MLFWQRYAYQNRELMMERILTAIRGHKDIPTFTLADKVVNCHHNYAFEETHFEEKVWVTRKGAVRAGQGDLGIIPGSMGASAFQETRECDQRPWEW